MDPFLYELTTVLSETQNQSAKSVKANVDKLSSYLVKDSIKFVKPRVQSTYILLAESPHVCEVRHGYPMAGDTGREVSRILGEQFGLKEPQELPALGTLLETCLPGQVWKRFGIMNVCRLPLQKTAYCKKGEENWLVGLKCLLHSFRTLRSDMSIGSEKRRTSIVREVQEAILTDLQRRLCKVSLKIEGRGQENHVNIIPCGQVAHHAIDQVCLPPALKRADTVPHPARNQWRYAKSLHAWLNQLQ